MRPQCALISLTNFVYIVFLLEWFKFGQSLADSEEQTKNGKFLYFICCMLL